MQLRRCILCTSIQFPHPALASLQLCSFAADTCTNPAIDVKQRRTAASPMPPMKPPTYHIYRIRTAIYPFLASPDTSLQHSISICATTPFRELAQRIIIRHTFSDHWPGALSICTFYGIQHLIISVIQHHIMHGRGERSSIVFWDGNYTGSSDRRVLTEFPRLLTSSTVPIEIALPEQSSYIG